MVKYTEARKRANEKWNAENLEAITLRVRKGDKEKIRAYAKTNGESLNGYINRLIKEDMNK
jgi:predicted HicB family RNase H-like nuclease